MTELAEHNTAQLAPSMRREDGMPVGVPFKQGERVQGGGRQAEALLRKRLELAADHAPPGMTALEAAMNSLAVVAQRPEHPAWRAAIQLVLERIDGHVPKTLRIEGELPLKVVVRGERD